MDKFTGIFGFFIALILPSMLFSQLHAEDFFDEHERPFDELVVFGEAISDTGNCVSIGCADLPDPPFFNGRPTNGPNSIDIFASLLLLDSGPSLHLVGPEQGTNYAVIGALAGGHREIDLAAQVDAHLGARGGVAGEDSLYFIFIGAQDVIDAVLEPDPAISSQIVQDAVEAIDESARRIVHAGGKHILIASFVDFGRSPFAIQLGAVEIATELSESFDRDLNNSVRNLDRELDANIYFFDFFSFGEEYLAISEQLGFVNDVDACLEVVDCDFDRFVFLSGFFLTARIHNFVGNRAFDSLARQLAEDVGVNVDRAGRRRSY